MSGKVPHSVQAKVTLYLKALEALSGDPTLGSFPPTVQIKLWHAQEFGEDDKASKEGQVQPGDRDQAAETRRGYGAEGR